MTELRFLGVFSEFAGAIAAVGVLGCAALLPMQAQQVAGTDRTNVPTAPATFSQAERLAARGHLEPAMSLLEILAQKQPEPEGVERLRGEILYQKQMLVQAQAAFSKALQQDPTDREAMEMSGVTLYRLAHPELAIPLLERANRTVSSANIDPEYVLGLCYMDVKRGTTEDAYCGNRSGKL